MPFDLWLIRSSISETIDQAIHGLEKARVAMVRKNPKGL
jgi:hypothetical protein